MPFFLAMTSIIMHLLLHQEGKLKMTKFETLIFIPEGTILDEKIAERNALRQTLDEVGEGFGPAERIKYTNLQSQINFLGFNERIELLLQTFCNQQLFTARKIFNKKMQKQKQLVKDVIPFLNEMENRINMILLAKEDQKTITSRLEESELLNYFSATYSQDDFEQKLPNKTILTKIIQEQNIDPDTCLVIGTDLADEIQGAENAELPSLWIAPRTVKMPIHPRPTIHLTKLNDLLFYLELS